MFSFNTKYNNNYLKKNTLNFNNLNNNINKYNKFNHWHAMFLPSNNQKNYYLSSVKQNSMNLFDEKKIVNKNHKNQINIEKADKSTQTTDLNEDFVIV